jgi:hypothetical protein
MITFHIQSMHLLAFNLPFVSNDFVGYNLHLMEKNIDIWYMKFGLD